MLVHPTTQKNYPPWLHDSYEAIGVPAETRETLRKRVEEMTQELSGVI